jgi:hypothetical protein
VPLLIEELVFDEALVLVSIWNIEVTTQKYFLETAQIKSIGLTAVSGRGDRCSGAGVMRVPGSTQSRENDR